MDVKDAIEKRRAYRSLAPVEITDDIIAQLVSAAKLAPSCFNNQPWKYIFVKSKDALERIKPVFNKGNEWCHAASLVIVVLAKKDFDCVIKEREYYLFDAGLATGQMILRAAELGLVAHPIAGYSPGKAREILGIPEDFSVVTLVNCGKKDERYNNGLLNEKQAESERSRPERLPDENVFSIDAFDARLNVKVEH